MCEFVCGEKKGEGKGRGEKEVGRELRGERIELKLGNYIPHSSAHTHTHTHTHTPWYDLVTEIKPLLQTVYVKDENLGGTSCSQGDH